MSRFSTDRTLVSWCFLTYSLLKSLQARDFSTGFKRLLESCNRFNLLGSVRSFGLFKTGRRKLFAAASLG